MHMKIMYNPTVEEKFYLDEVHRTLRSAVIVMVTLNKSLEKMVTKCHKLLEKSLFVYQLQTSMPAATYHSDVVLALTARHTFWPPTVR